MMNMKQWLRADYLPVPLIALMVLTRFHHFGDALHLPDASLAVFFFAGFYQRGKALFAFLLALAVLIDIIAIANGSSDWCVSPAYIFLLPTYAVMWFAGCYCSTFKALDSTALAVSLGWVALATSVAFVISNGSFYLFSGRYEDLLLADYAIRVIGYYPLYLGATLLYVLAGYTFVKLFKPLPEADVGHKSV